MSDRISTKYITRRGKEMTLEMTREQAIARLAFLDEQERLTKQIAPSDSGDTRFNYNAAANALRASLTNELVS